jgi:hypothetical protein
VEDIVAKVKRILEQQEPCLTVAEVVPIKAPDGDAILIGLPEKRPAADDVESA